MTVIFKWQRTCQECGAKGFYTKPNLDSKAEGWRNTKCRKCKNDSLDFGSEVSVDSETNKVIIDDSWDE